MAYIGRGIDNISNASLLDDITFTDSAGPYNLLQDAVAFTPISVQALVISIDGIIQDPASYTISAATITFDSVMAATSTNDFIVHNGVGIVNVPTDGSVTTAKIEDLAVTAGKLAATQDLSTKTITLPASVSGLGTGITNSQLAGSIDVTTKITGVVPSANLGSGSASSTTILYGDSTYKAEPAGGSAWQSVVTGATLSAVAGNGYPINTTSNACTVTLPAGSVGDTIEIVDYAGTFDTNAVTLTTTEKIKGSDDDGFLKQERQGVKLVYVDATQGWEVITGVNESAPAVSGPEYEIVFLVVAGGGGGGSGNSSTDPSGGGGAGGHRTLTETIVQATTITVDVGGGGAGGAGGSPGGVGTNGENSSISGGAMTTITSNGGGGGGMSKTNSGAGIDGGSGSGASYNSSEPTGGASSPVTSPVQGYGGGGSSPSGSPYNSGGGGGAGGAGVTGTSPESGDGGVGAITTIMTTTMATANAVGEVDGSDVYFAGGGGGASWGSSDGLSGEGGLGGGGQGGEGGAGSASPANTGGGAGGTGGASAAGVAGGSGCVVLRMLTSDYTTTITGSPDVDTDGSYTVLTYTGDGTYVT